MVLTQLLGSKSVWLHKLERNVFCTALQVHAMQQRPW